MTWFKSRYVRSLEEQVAGLKEEKTALQAQVAQLLGLRTLAQQLNPTLASAPEGKAEKQRKYGNWLRIRQQLEDPNVKVSEADETQERTQ